MLVPLSALVMQRTAELIRRGGGNKASVSRLDVFSSGMILQCTLSAVESQPHPKILAGRQLGASQTYLCHRDHGHWRRSRRNTSHRSLMDLFADRASFDSSPDAYHSSTTCSSCHASYHYIGLVWCRRLNTSAFSTLLCICIQTF